MVKAATAPPGVDNINVCFDLEVNQQVIPAAIMMQSSPYVYPKLLMMILLTAGTQLMRDTLPAILNGLQLLSAPFGILAESRRKVVNSGCIYTKSYALTQERGEYNEPRADVRKRLYDLHAFERTVGRTTLPIAHALEGSDTLSAREHTRMYR